MNDSEGGLQVHHPRGSNQDLAPRPEAADARASCRRRGYLDPKSTYKNYGPKTPNTFSTGKSSYIAPNLQKEPRTQFVDIVLRSTYSQS